MRGPLFALHTKLKPCSVHNMPTDRSRGVLGRILALTVTCKGGANTSAIWSQVISPFAVAIWNGFTRSTSEIPSSRMSSSEMAWKLAPESISHGALVDLNKEAEKLTIRSELVWSPRRSHSGGPGAS